MGLSPVFGWRILETPVRNPDNTPDSGRAVAPAT